MERDPRTTSTPPARSHPLRRVVVLLGVFALMLAALAGPAAAKPRGKAHGAFKAHGPVRTVDVMTRNLYLGADLTPIVTALASGNEGAIVAAASSTWQQVVASSPEERMAAIADEIVATRPEAVGLQEVTEWTTYDYDPNTGQFSSPQVAYDFLDLLLEALAEDGMSYREVAGATATNFTSPPIPIVDPAYPVTVVDNQPVPNRAVQLIDRDVIIVRDDVQARKGRNGNFDTILDLGTDASPLPVDRGWGSADLRYRQVRFRFVNTHTEAFGPEEIRVGEVLELLEAQNAIRPPMHTVYAGDFNSAPGEGGYETLLSGGLHDLWNEARPTASDAESDTCCQDALLRNDVSALSTRIDLLLGTRGVRAMSAERVGDEPVDLPDGVNWASDHAGVVATVRIPRRMNNWR